MVRATKPADGARPIRLLVVGHLASRSGSPKVLLNVLRWLEANANFDITLALAEGGPLLEDYRAVVSRMLVLDEPRRRRRAEFILELSKRLHLAPIGRLLSRALVGRALVDTTGFELVYANSVSSLRALKHRQGGPPLLLHVHELHTAVQICLPNDAAELLHMPDRLLAVSEPVAQMLIDDFEIEPRHVRVVTGCVSDEMASQSPVSQDAARAGIGLEAAPYVVGSGRLEWQKGFDVFVATALRVTQLRPGHQLRWLWIGGGETLARRRAALDLEKAGLADTVRILPEQPDLTAYFEAADLLLLSSKEDSYPLTVLEAALAERPIVCQSASAGGAASFVSRGAGIVVPYLDIDGLARAVLKLVDDPSEAREMGRRGRQLVLEEHLSSQISSKILQALTEML